MVAAMRPILEAAKSDPRVSKVALARLNEMNSFVATLDGWFGQMLTVPPSTLMALIKMGARVVGLLGLGRGKSDG